MPFIRITVAKSLAAHTKQDIARGATDLIVAILGKRREVTAVLVENIAIDGWSIGGEAIDGADLTPVHAEICITAGTNSAAEKAQMIASLQALLGNILGAIPAASYIVIRDLPADNWGYAGLTQAARRQMKTGL